MSDDWPGRNPPGGKPEWGAGYNRYPAACSLCGQIAEPWTGVLWAETGKPPKTGGRFHVICEECWESPSIPSIHDALWDQEEKP